MTVIGILNYKNVSSRSSCPIFKKNICNESFISRDKIMISRKVLHEFDVIFTKYIIIHTCIKYETKYLIQYII